MNNEDRIEELERKVNILYQMLESHEKLIRSVDKKTKIIADYLEEQVKILSK